MSEEFLSRLENHEACCYLRLGAEDLKMWDFSVSDIASANRSLLFTAAGRPHFDYFFEQIDYLGLNNREDISLAGDERFKRQLESKISSLILSGDISGQALARLNNKPLKAVVIGDGKIGLAPGFADFPQIQLTGIELFGNTEPVWLSLKSRLPRNTDVFFLALGSEKFLIGPRLKMFCRKPVVDISNPSAQPLKSPSGFNGWLKKLIS